MGAADSTVKVDKITKYDGKDPKRSEKDINDGRYFEPTLAIAWLIGNSKYDNVRKAGKTAYLDID